MTDQDVDNRLGFAKDLGFSKWCRLVLLGKVRDTKTDTVLVLANAARTRLNMINISAFFLALVLLFGGVLEPALWWVIVFLVLLVALNFALLWNSELEQKQ